MIVNGIKIDRIKAENVMWSLAKKNVTFTFGRLITELRHAGVCNHVTSYRAADRILARNAKRHKIRYSRTAGGWMLV